MMLSLTLLAVALAYGPSSTRTHIPGLWKLIPHTRNDETTAIHNLLLMMKEDGSFEQYYDTTPNESSTTPDTLRLHSPDSSLLESNSLFGRAKGQWDLVDGNLLLAFHRPHNAPANLRDTLLVAGMPAQKANQARKDSKSSAGAQESDAFLSVNGTIQVGRFVYPKNHPSFFESPILFQTKIKEEFSLDQLFAESHLVTNSQPELVELFQQKDFHGKRFSVVSMPIGKEQEDVHGTCAGPKQVSTVGLSNSHQKRQVFIYVPWKYKCLKTTRLPLLVA